MNFSIRNHLLFLGEQQVRFVQSPNISSGTIVPRYVIEHYTNSTSLEGTVSWFKSKDSQVSSQLVVGLDGEVVQFCKLNQKAWHAGKSEWDGIEGLNSFSIGIEIVNAGRLTKKGDLYFSSEGKQIPSEQVLLATHKNETSPSYWMKYTDKQIEVVKEITDLLVKTYGIKNVLGHDDIAPGRKSDPGPAFPMSLMKPTNITKTVRTTANINLRVGAGTDYKSIEVLPKGISLEELNKTSGWTRVKHGNVLGYVKSDYLN